MDRATQRAQEKPLRLSKNWCTAIVIFPLRDITALGDVAICCHKFGSVYWKQHYWALFMAVGPVLLVIELSWMTWQCLFEQNVQEGQMLSKGKTLFKGQTLTILQGCLMVMLSPAVHEYNSGKITHGARVN